MKRPSGEAREAFDLDVVDAEQDVGGPRRRRPATVLLLIALALAGVVYGVIRTHSHPSRPAAVQQYADEAPAFRMSNPAETTLFRSVRLAYSLQLVTHRSVRLAGLAGNPAGFQLVQMRAGGPSAGSSGVPRLASPVEIDPGGSISVLTIYRRTGCPDPHEVTQVLALDVVLAGQHRTVPVRLTMASPFGPPTPGCRLTITPEADAIVPSRGGTGPATVGTIPAGTAVAVEFACDGGGTGTVTVGSSTLPAVDCDGATFIDDLPAAAAARSAVVRVDRGVAWAAQIVVRS